MRLAGFRSRPVLGPDRVVVGAYPWPLARLSSHVCGEVYEWLGLLGFWDMEDGDYYVRGRWNWCFWRHPWARRNPEWAATVVVGDRWPLAFHRSLVRTYLDTMKGWS